MTRPHDGTVGDMEREIRELRAWEEYARRAWSVCVDLPPDECPGPEAVYSAVDALDDRGDAAYAKGRADERADVVAAMRRSARANGLAPIAEIERGAHVGAARRGTP